MYSPSPGFRSPSPSFSQSSFKYDNDSSESEIGDLAVLAPDEMAGHPGPSSAASTAEQGVDTVTCLWEDCGVVFTHLPTLIEHIHSTHIGVHKSNYTCEWATCNRRGLAQTSRFALISHIRSHTGEKPFICARPGKSRAFRCFRLRLTRRRMRQILHPLRCPCKAHAHPTQHAPASFRTWWVRKRKRGDSPQPSFSNAPPTEPPSAFNTFKIEPRSPSEAGGPAGDYFDAVPPPQEDGEDGLDEDDEDDGLPPHLAQLIDPHSGLLMGRSPTLVKYVIQKAKMRFALETHAALIEELRVARTQAREEKLKERSDAR
ncbi:hypothetical protein BU15DRAFT_61181 [Melanogaster broomeanus]|nr:hypothetical protein BU15DRAFT_61181 [Melanogaster broomeanus]